MLSPVLGLPALLAKMEHIGDAMVLRLPLQAPLPTPRQAPLARQKTVFDLEVDDDGQVTTMYFYFW